MEGIETETTKDAPSVEEFDKVVEHEVIDNKDILVVDKEDIDDKEDVTDKEDTNDKQDWSENHEDAPRNGFWERQAKRVARNPCVHLWTSLLLAIGLSVIAMVIGKFSVR
jgi:hypothetical protein